MLCSFVIWFKEFALVWDDACFGVVSGDRDVEPEHYAPTSVQSGVTVGPVPVDEVGQSGTVVTPSPTVPPFATLRGVHRGLNVVWEDPGLFTCWAGCGHTRNNNEQNKSLEHFRPEFNTKTSQIKYWPRLMIFANLFNVYYVNKESNWNRGANWTPSTKSEIKQKHCWQNNRKPVTLLKLQMWLLSFILW